MKTVKFYAATLATLCFMIATLNVSAQSNSYKEIIDLDGKPLAKEWQLQITKNNTSVRVRVEGMVTNGNVSATLYDPNGNQSCRLKLNAGNNGKAKGNLQQTKDARPGTWTLKIENDTANGRVKVNFEEKVSEI